jgi:DNA-binding MarR family transcriptional regulator
MGHIINGMEESHPAEAIAAIRSWYRLQRATVSYGRELQLRHGVTGEQLAILRIVAEQVRWALAELRSRLVMHPATLGQILDRLAKQGLVHLDSDRDDRRRRVVVITARGRSLLSNAPLAGPVRLRTVPAPAADLIRLTKAFEDAVTLFGLEEWAS